MLHELLLGGAGEIRILPGRNTVTWLNFNCTLQVLISATPISTQGLARGHGVMDMIGRNAVSAGQLNRFLQVAAGALQVARIQAFDSHVVELLNRPQLKTRTLQAPVAHHDVQPGIVRNFTQFALRSLAKQFARLLKSLRAEELRRTVEHLQLSFGRFLNHFRTRLLLCSHLRSLTKLQIAFII